MHFNHPGEVGLASVTHVIKSLTPFVKGSKGFSFENMKDKIIEQSMF